MEYVDDKDEKIPLPNNVKLYFKESEGKGRGVFAGEDIKKSTLLSISSFLLFPSPPSTPGSTSTTTPSSEREVLNHYTYTFGMDCQALALGLGSMYNHSSVKQNVGFFIDKKRRLIRHIAIEDVKEDTELCINYGPKLWFVDEERVKEEERLGQRSHDDCHQERGAGRGTADDQGMDRAGGEEKKNDTQRDDGNCEDIVRRRMEKDEQEGEGQEKEESRPDNFLFALSNDLFS